MDLNQPNNETIIIDLYTRAKKAANAGDKRASGLLINEILKLNFTHAGAWALLHTQYGGGKSFAEFQREFAGKYFPAQAHLLEKPVPPPVSEPPVFQDLEDTGPLKIKPAAPLPQAWGETPPLTIKPGPVIAPPPVILPAPVVQPAQAPQGEIRFCPRCGQERTAGMPFCARCAYQFAPGSQPAHIGTVMPPVQVTPQAPPAYPRPVLPAAAAPSRFTPRRIIAAIGLLLIILAGIVNWSSSRQWQGIFNGGYANFGDIGLGTDQGKATTAAGLLGFILLFSIRSETPAHLWSAIFAIAAGIAAGIFASGNWGYSGGYEGLFVNYSSMGPGPYMVFIGAAIVLACIFIPSQKTD